MRILIGTYEIAGWVHQYKKGFESLGHQVTTAVFEKVSWFDHEYDHILNSEYLKSRDQRKLEKSQVLQRLVRKVRNKKADLDYRKYIFNLIDQHDLVIVFWRPFIPTYNEYTYIRKRNKKLVTIFVGSDARYFQSFQQEFDISHFTFPEAWKKTNPDFHLRFVRQAEKFADSIYSVPDQAGLQLRPYYHLQVPVALDGITFRNNQRKIPRVLHAPGIPYKKGTNIIESVLQKLKREGIQFETVLVTDIPHAKLLQLLADIDVVVDEIVFHGPGALSFEAMLSGCAVATRHIEDSPACFKPPVWHIDAENIYKKLKELLTDYSLQQKLIEAGRNYVLRNNTAQKVAGNIISNLEDPAKFDYFPRFLRYHYQPLNNDEATMINKWTDFVRDCDWYKEYVQPGERAGLRF